MLIKINNQPLLEIFIPLTFSENIANSRFINQTPVSESFLQRINFIFNLTSKPVINKKRLTLERKQKDIFRI